ADAAARIGRGGTSGEIAACEQDAPALRRDDPEDGLQQRRLAGAVAPEQRHDLVLVNLEGGSHDDVALAVERADFIEVEDERAARPLGVTAGPRGERRGARPDINLAYRLAFARVCGGAVDQHFAFV